MRSDGVDTDELRQLMTQYQAGSMDAFEGIYAMLSGSLRGYLVSLARDRALADDLLQESFLQVHRSRHTYRADLPVRPWVFAIARHVWLMDRRSRSRRPQPDGELPEIPVTAEMETLANRDTLARALDTVLPDRREALLLHHVWGFSFQEIGRMLGIRPDAAKLRSSRGMGDLRSQLRPSSPPERRDA